MASGGAGDGFDYFQPAFREDPYAFYRRLRDDDPVHWGMPFEPSLPGVWHVARYADIVAVLKDARYTHQPPREDSAAGEALAGADPVQLYFTLVRQSLLFNDPPEHTRLRALVSRAFTPRMVEALRPRVAAVANTLVDAAAARGSLDVIADYARPLTIAIIAEMLGVPEEAQRRLSAWAGVLVRAVDCKRTPEIYDEAARVALEIYAYFNELLAARRGQAGNGLLALMQATHEQDGDRLSEPELIVTATTLLVAGHETTVNLIGNGTLALLRHPEQLALLRERPELAAGAVEEFLRYDAPSQMASRYVTEDMMLGGKTIQRGQVLNLLLGSGNRDPEAFAEPDRLDITRGENRHLAFGMGMHYCLGAPLARLEGQVALPLLLRRLPGLRALDAEPVWRDTVGFRGLARLPVAWG
ncbi:MAG: Putative cytochrome P450 hydroxylase [Ktedonobacterales bacterium]|jgi:cytochrome P450|nr:MAG: Putative cytochrome P450 hydroxylase [Ktedonobacterales bacterium]